MLFRTTSRTVTFRMPFSIAAVEHELPAGAYLLETDEELIQGLSFPAYRRVTAFLQTPSRRVSGALHSVPVARKTSTLRWRGTSPATTKRKISERPLTMGGEIHENPEWLKPGLYGAAVGAPSPWRSSAFPGADG